MEDSAPDRKQHPEGGPWSPEEKNKRSDGQGKAKESAKLTANRKHADMQKKDTCRNNEKKKTCRSKSDECHTANVDVDRSDGQQKLQETEICATAPTPCYTLQQRIAAMVGYQSASKPSKFRNWSARQVSR